MIAEQKFKQKINSVVEDQEHDKGNIVTLYKDAEKVVTLSDHSSKGNKFGTLRIFYNTSAKSELRRTITQTSILQDLPDDVFNDILNVIIKLTINIPELEKNSLLDIECEKIYPHSKNGIALFKTDVKLPDPNKKN